MKKKMIALLAGALMTLGASNAMAYFADGDLIRVVYDSAGTFEQATDLGSITALSSASNLTIGGIDTSSVADKSGLMVTYFAKQITGTGTGSFYIAQDATQTTSAGINGSKWSSIGASSMASVYTYYNSKGTATVNVLTTDTNSYAKKLDQSNTSPGLFAGLTDASTKDFAEVSLSDIANVNAMNLYYFQDGNAKQTVSTPYLTILTDSTGTHITGTATPIPAAAYLLGSGLMGLFGLRRKNRA